MTDVEWIVETGGMFSEEERDSEDKVEGCKPLQPSPVKEQHHRATGSF